MVFFYCEIGAIKLILKILKEYFEKYNLKKIKA